ncbi:FG-GAP-like repeat-containing protein [Streptomyces sp. NPDC099050]|uniref:FG-GAP-like repeat-containing protein n=1 Tax=Streptomyces sp. NPDC099050 TaxID=3366100 RepID=UPI00382A834D
MSFSLRKKLVSLAIATAAAAPILGAVPAAADSAAVASIAFKQVGNDCTPYYGCEWPTAWCADFARWVWGQAGADYTSALDARAVSFYEYGSKYGTLHSVPQVGDAVLYDTDGSVTDGEANHVNLVVKVSADGTKIQTVGGNESRGVRHRDWFDWKNNPAPVGSSAGRVLKFIGPKGLADTSTPSGAPAPVSAVGDLTGDGKPDLLARAESGSGNLYVYPGAGNGHFGTRIDNGGWSSMERVSGIGDVTGDGKADVAAVEKSTGKLWIYPGQSNGHLGTRIDNSGGWGDIRITGAKDLNGDGRGDLLAVDEASGKLWMYPGRTDGHFGTRVEAGSSWDSMNPVGSAGDLTGDGKNDVAAVEDATGKLFVYPGLGNGQFGARIQAGTGWDVMSSISGAGDYTGDGKDDLIARDNTGKLWVYPGQGNGQLGARIDNGGGWNFTG